MQSFTIKDLENLSGIKAHTIRIWEQRYNFLKPSRTGTNIRYYSNNELKKLLNVALLNKYGFKISHIDKMTEADIQDKIMALGQMEAQQERILYELIEATVDFNQERFEDILDNYIQSRGIERAINQVMFPFLEKVGILWLTNHVNPAQEHLVSNIIRQKIIMGIESVNNKVQVNKTVLLFLPEGEYHEIGLLFMNFMLKSRGIHTIYLGCSIPIGDLEYVVKMKNPDYLYTHLTAISPKFNMDRFAHALTKHFAGIPIIISGQLTHTYEKKITPPLNFKKSFAEVMEFVSSL